MLTSMVNRRLRMPFMRLVILITNRGYTKKFIIERETYIYDLKNEEFD